MKNSESLLYFERKGGTEFATFLNIPKEEMPSIHPLSSLLLPLFFSSPFSSPPSFYSGLLVSGGEVRQGKGEGDLRGRTLIQFITQLQTQPTTLPFPRKKLEAQNDFLRN